MAFVSEVDLMKQRSNIIDMFCKELPFFDNEEILQQHKLFLTALAVPEMTVDQLMKRHDMRFLIVALDYYECDNWVQALVRLVADNAELYQRVFYELLMMSFVDNGCADRFMELVNLSKEKKYKYSPVVLPVRRPIARSFSDIIKAIGTYSERKLNKTCKLYFGVVVYCSKHVTNKTPHIMSLSRDSELHIVQSHVNFIHI